MPSPVRLLTLSLLSLAAGPVIGQNRGVTVVSDAALLKAAESGDAPAVTKLVDLGASVKARDKRGWTPLIYAASYGDTDLVKALLDRGADPNARASEGDTALWAAAGSGVPSAVKVLLDHGAKVNARTTYGSSALEFASEMGTLQTVQMLVDHGANLKTQGPGALSQAVFKGRSAVVHYLVAKGVAVNQKKWDTGSYPKNMDYGWSTLMIAIKRGNTGIASFLITKGANVHVKSKKGMTALKLAAMRGYDDLVRQLKKAGAKE